MYNYTEQIKCDIVKIRIDIISKEKINGILSDMNFTISHLICSV